MRLRAEFTTEPFHGEGDPPAHATAALDAVRTAGLEAEFGPFGTAVTGDEDTVYGALPSVFRAAIEHGATRITLQVERADG
jgi:uncharacterized protein YqgV (UPF0045/DUF77 family)